MVLICDDVHIVVDKKTTSHVKQHHLNSTIQNFPNGGIGNNQVVSWLIKSMSIEIGENFYLYSTAKQIWDAAQDTFSNKESTVELFKIKSTLQDLKQGVFGTTYYTTL